MLNPELAIIVSSSTRLITQLTGVLRRFYAQVEVLDRVEELFSPVNPAGMPAPEPITPVLPSLLVLDYASPLPDPYLLQICRELNGQLILICPEEHNGSAALDYALEGCFDEFIVLPADYAALPYRIQKLKRSLKLPLAESSQQSSIDDEQYQTANLMTLTHVFHCMVLPDRTMRRMGGSEATFKEVVGLTYEQLYAKGGWKALVHPDDMAEREACNQAVLRGEKSVCDYRIVTPDHQYRWIREYSQPIIEGGRVARIDGVIQDVTSLKMAQNTELKQHQTIEAMHHATLMLSSTLDLNAVLDRILISLETVLPYDAADVALIENGQGRIVRHRGYTERGLDDVVSQIQFDLAEYPGLTHMMTTGKPIVIQNVRQSPMWRTVENPELEWMASYIGAPIFLHGRVAGFLNLNSQQPNHYQPEYLFLLEAFASQVSAAITNADLHDIVVHHSSELEGRVRDMVLVYEIGKALTSTLNLYKIYTLFYQDFIKTLFASAELQVFLIDQGDSDGYVCDFAIADGKELNTDEISLTLDEVALLSQAIIDDDHVQFNGVFYQPLITRGDPIGVLKIIPGPDDNPEAIDITLLTIVTSVAATAIDNARLYTTVTEQHREIMALYRATRVLYKTDNVADLAWLITSSIVAEFNYLDCGIILHNEHTGQLDRVVRTGAYTLEVAGSLSPDGKGLVPVAARTGEVVYAPDVREDPRYLASDARTRSELVVPLVTARGIIGVLDLQSTRVDAFTEQDQRVLAAFAERAAAAIENVQLMEKIRNHATELEQRVFERTEDLRTALKKEREIKELKSRFLTMVSHQFRTPMTAIQSSKEMLKNYSFRMTAEQLNNRYDILDNAIRDMIQLLEDAVMMNRITEGEMILAPVLVELNGYTRSIIDDFIVSNKKSHQIVYASDDKDTFTLIDRDIWRKVVSELLGNAAKFSAPNSLIKCTLISAASEYQFMVQDQGIGIPPEDVERVFGMFDRGANAENITGSGLGLTIVKQSIERHGGKVQLISQPGTGTTVTIYLPRYVLEGVL